MQIETVKCKFKIIKVENYSGNFFFKGITMVTFFLFSSSMCKWHQNTRGQIITIQRHRNNRKPINPSAKQPKNSYQWKPQKTQQKHFLKKSANSSKCKEGIPQPQHPHHTNSTATATYNLSGPNSICRTNMPAISAVPKSTSTTES